MASASRALACAALTRRFVGIGIGLHAGAGQRQHGLVDAGGVHIGHASRAQIQQPSSVARAPSPAVP
jgi:hypothetical protein